jgi:RimJ/RimL family protein N-acetyltransferase
MIFAETERLYLRALEKHELPRLVELIGDWDVTRWLAVVPYPYTLQNAQEFYEDILDHYEQGKPQFHTIALKTDNQLIGGIGLHPPRNTNYSVGQMEIGYWLGKPFWGQGLMSEAALAIANLGFSRSETLLLAANTTPDNLASQKILRKLGMRHLGVVPLDYPALRGPDQIIKWELSRSEWFAGQSI